jgi:hypothetical protein
LIIVFFLSNIFGIGFLFWFLLNPALTPTEFVVEFEAEFDVVKIIGEAAEESKPVPLTDAPNKGR